MLFKSEVPSGKLCLHPFTYTYIKTLLSLEVCYTSYFDFNPIPSKLKVRITDINTDIKLIEVSNFGPIGVLCFFLLTLFLL